MAVYSRPNTYAGHLHDSGASWLDWAEFVSQCFEDAGFVNVYRETAWASVVTPSTTSTVANTEIWAFNDSLQSAYPIYVKLRYASGSSSIVGKGSAWLLINIADAWDEVSDLTGPNVSEAVMQRLLDATGSIGSITIEARVSASATQGRFAYANVPAAGTNYSYGGAFCIERTRSANGLTPNGAIVCALNLHTAVAGGSFGLYWSRAGSGTIHNGIPILLGQNGKNQSGSLTAVSPWYVFNGPAMPPPISFVVTDQNTGTHYGTLNVPLYGVAREYYNLGNPYETSLSNRHGNGDAFGTPATREWMINV